MFATGDSSSIFCLSSSLRIGMITYPGLVEEFSDSANFRKWRLHIKIIKEYLLIFRVIFLRSQQGSHF